MKAAFVLFCISVVYFGARGPWRAVHSVNSYDFASVYGAARNWLRGQNPYDMQTLADDVHRAGDDPATMPNTEPPPSVYLPTALPLVASVAWLPWKLARLVWSCLSTAVFVLSLSLLFRTTDLSAAGKWLLAAGVFFFSPASSGLSTGNPSVLSCGLTMLAVSLLIADRGHLAALALGLAHCLKPQISIAAVAVFALWSCWRPMLLSFIIPVIAGITSALRAASFKEFEYWLTSLRRGLADISAPGSMNDPSASNYFSYHMVNSAAILAVWIHDLVLVNTGVWLIAGSLTICYLWMRRNLEGDRRSRDLAFFSAVTLTIVYHRYYDAQLLLMCVPFLLFAPSGKSNAARLALWICMLVMLFPLQAIFAESLQGAVPPTSLAGFLLLRHQPAIVLLMCLFMIPWSAKTAANRMETSVTG